MIAAALIALASPQSPPALPACTTTSVCPGVMTGPLNWQRATKPSEIVLGASRPVLGGLRWKTYNGTEATATGWGEGELPGCTQPSYLCPFGKRPVTVTFLHPRKGGAGKWYYSRMHVAGNVAGLGIKADWGITNRGFWG